MPKLFDNDTKAFIGDITNEQLQFLKDQLEEESMEDKDYAIEGMTLAFFKEQGIDAGLLDLLSFALGDREQMIIRWE